MTKINGMGIRSSGISVSIELVQHEGGEEPSYQITSELGSESQAVAVEQMKEAMVGAKEVLEKIINDFNPAEVSQTCKATRLSLDVPVR